MFIHTGVRRQSLHVCGMVESSVNASLPGFGAGLKPDTILRGAPAEVISLHQQAVPHSVLLYVINITSDQTQSSILSERMIIHTISIEECQDSNNNYFYHIFSINDYLFKMTNKFYS